MIHPINVGNTARIKGSVKFGNQDEGQRAQQEEENRWQGIKSALDFAKDDTLIGELLNPQADLSPNQTRHYETIAQTTLLRRVFERVFAGPSEQNPEAFKTTQRKRNASGLLETLRNQLKPSQSLSMTARDTVHALLNWVSQPVDQQEAAHPEENEPTDRYTGPVFEPDLEKRYLKEKLQSTQSRAFVVDVLDRALQGKPEAADLQEAAKSRLLQLVESRQAVPIYAAPPDADGVRSEQLVAHKNDVKGAAADTMKLLAAMTSWIPGDLFNGLSKLANKPE